MLQVFGAHVEVAVLDAARDALVVRLDADGDPMVEGYREGLRTTHPAEASGHGDRAGQGPAEPFFRNGRKRLVRALEDALRPDVDPRAGRHLAVHRQAER